MSLTTKPYKGTRDLFPKQKRILNYLLDTMSQTAHSFGFEPYDGPLLEEVSLYKAKSGEEIVAEQMYDFTDRGKRHVAIRPEMTPTLARMIASSHRETPKPIRWFSFPNLMRYERPQRGRLREHWQLNCDIFGSPEGYGELEIFQMLIGLMKNFGANHSQFCILTNDRRFVDQLFKSVLNLSEEKVHKVYKIIDRYKKIPQEETEKQLSEVVQETTKIEVLLKYLKVDSLDSLQAFANEQGIGEQVNPLTTLFSQLSSMGLDQFLKYDPTIVRGLDYYTGIVFEGYDLNPENPRAICGGGSYAGLIQLFGQPKLEGVGFGLGDVTLTHFLETHKLLPDFTHSECDFFVSLQSEEAFSFALGVADKLRNAGMSAVFHPSPLKFNKVFNQAEKKGAKLVLFLGDNEKEEKKVSWRNLKTKEQGSVEIDQLESLKEILNGK